MRIAMFTETFLPGTDGIVTRLCATLKHLEAQGHEVLLFAPAGGPSEYASAKVIGVPAFRFFLYPEKKFAMPWGGYARHIREFQPDFIHTLNPAFVGLTAIYYAKRFRLPLVASFHTNVPRYARHYHLNWLEPVLWWYFRTLHNQAQINLCTSRATLEELDEHGFKNLGLWERGVDVSLFSPGRRNETMRKRLAPDAGPDDKILLYVGRLASEKNLEQLVPGLKQQHNVHFAVVGDGPHRRDLERAFAGTHTVFTGYMFGEELAEAYASADGFLFPSTTETLGLVLFEAMASGLPIMAANSAPTQEVLESGKAGLIFQSGDLDSLLETMRELLFDESRRSAINERAAEIVQELDWRRPTEQLLSHYETLTPAVQRAHSTRVPDSRW